MSIVKNHTVQSFDGGTRFRWLNYFNELFSYIKLFWFDNATTTLTSWENNGALFLDASSYLYMRVCPSVCPYVRPYVRPLPLGKNRRDASYCPPGLVFFFFSFDDWHLNCFLSCFAGGSNAVTSPSPAIKTDQNKQKQNNLFLALPEDTQEVRRRTRRKRKRRRRRKRKKRKKRRRR